MDDAATVSVSTMSSRRLCRLEWQIVPLPLTHFIASTHHDETHLRRLLQGLFTILPLLVTLLVLYWLGAVAEESLGTAIKWFLPETWNVTGMGVVAGIALSFVIAGAKRRETDEVQPLPDSNV